MDAERARAVRVVVALFDALDPGTTFSRREWPAHVTLAPNFVVDETHEVIEHRIRGVVGAEAPLPIQFASEALFGPDGTIPVQLVDSAPVVALHGRLADSLKGAAGFAAEEPSYWRAGYRPHMTHVSSESVREGDHRRLPYVAIAELTDNRATITSLIALTGE